jgi:hypothetical protein
MLLTGEALEFFTSFRTFQNINRLSLTLSFFSSTQTTLDTCPDDRIQSLSLSLIRLQTRSHHSGTTTSGRNPRHLPAVLVELSLSSCPTRYSTRTALQASTPEHRRLAGRPRARARCIPLAPCGSYRRRRSFCPHCYPAPQHHTHARTTHHTTCAHAGARPAARARLRSG